MYDDRLEIYSPGGMYRGKPIQDYDLEEIESVRRNLIIADLFHRMKFMERRGSGIRKILDETAKLPGYTENMKPQFHSTTTSFFVILKNHNYSGQSYLKPLLEAGRLTMTIPEKPNSQKQKYICARKTDRL